MPGSASRKRYDVVLGLLPLAVGERVGEEGRMRAENSLVDEEGLVAGVELSVTRVVEVNIISPAQPMYHICLDSSPDEKPSEE